MRINLKGLNRITKRLAGGSKRTYHYAWKGGPALRGEPGSPEFIASYNEAVAAKVAPPTGVLLALLFRFQDSAEFQFDISPRTRRDYVQQIKRIEKEFGDFPIKALMIRGRHRYFWSGATVWRKPHCDKRTTLTAPYRASSPGRRNAD